MLWKMTAVGLQVAVVRTTGIMPRLCGGGSRASGKEVRLWVIGRSYREGSLEMLVGG